MDIIKYMLFLATCASAAIIPEELPSLLSVAYSNIPPIKKGTDSRVGFGFSLGNHADFQVLFELGPQSETNPIGTSYASSSKRQVNERPKKSTQKDKVPDSNAGNFLSNWSQNMKRKQTGKQPFKPLPIPGESENSNPLSGINLLNLLTNVGQTGEETMEGEIVLKQPQPSDVSKETLTQLKQLFGGKYATQPPATDRPRFVQRMTRKPAIKVPKPVNNDGKTFERLSYFNVNDEENVNTEKRKITEDLSDVSLDDE